MASESEGQQLPASLRIGELVSGWLASAMGGVLPIIPSTQGQAWSRSPDMPPTPADQRPDLRPLDPSDLRLEVRSDSSRVLRLANTVWNAGEGPLELRGEPEVATQGLRVFLVIHSADGTTSERPVGTFHDHPTLAHWHLDDFALC